jgi:TonB family protein
MKTAASIAVSISLLLLAPVVLRAQTAAAQAVKRGPGVTLPVVVSDVKPSYTPDAMRDGVQGAVRLECVVGVDGTVGDVRVVESLDPGLDAQSVDALKQWRFKPGSKDGVVVPVLVEVEMTFTLGPREGPSLGSPEIVREGAAGLTLPQVIEKFDPVYTTDAREARVQGSVVLDIVVLPSGRVGDVRVAKPLTPGLNREAIRAVRRWRFAPGRIDGRAVPVQVSIETTFALR